MLCHVQHLLSPVNNQNVLHRGLIISTRGDRLYLRKTAGAQITQSWHGTKVVAQEINQLRDFYPRPR